VLSLEGADVRTGSADIVPETNFLSSTQNRLSILPLDDDGPFRMAGAGCVTIGATMSGVTTADAEGFRFIMWRTVALGAKTRVSVGQVIVIRMITRVR
jgi:hypothetical protein